MNDSKKIVLIGGGGHARSLAESGCHIDGYADTREVTDMPLPRIGSDEDILSSMDPLTTYLHIAIVGGDGRSMSARRRIIERFSSFPAATLIAPSATVTPSSTIGEGSAVLCGAIINGASIGSHNVVNTGAIVEHGCHTGSNDFIGPGAVICGGVTIGDDCFIGAGVTIRNCVSICRGVTIGIGAAVVSDITRPGIWAGVPARRLSSSDKQ